MTDQTDYADYSDHRLNPWKKYISNSFKNYFDLNHCSTKYVSNNEITYFGHTLAQISPINQSREYPHENCIFAYIQNVFFQDGAYSGDKIVKSMHIERFLPNRLEVKLMLSQYLRSICCHCQHLLSEMNPSSIFILLNSGICNIHFPL